MLQFTPLTQFNTSRLTTPPTCGKQSLTEMWSSSDEKEVEKTGASAPERVSPVLRILLADASAFGHLVIRQYLSNPPLPLSQSVSTLDTLRCWRHRITGRLCCDSAAETLWELVKEKGFVFQ